VNGPTPLLNIFRIDVGSRTRDCLNNRACVSGGIILTHARAPFWPDEPALLGHS